MDKILKEYNNIVRNDRRKNIIVIGLLLLMGLMIISYSAFIFKAKIFVESHRIILDSDGTPRKYHFIDAKTAEEVEAKNHILYFINNFYDFDRWNVESHINNALWISDNSVKELYKSFASKGWYSEIIRQGIKQEAVVDNTQIQIELTKEPYHCQLPVKINLRSGSKCESYKIIIDFYLERVSESFPTNPHGFMITNFSQTEFELIK